MKWSLHIYIFSQCIKNLIDFFFHSTKSGLMLQLLPSSMTGWNEKPNQVWSYNCFNETFVTSNLIGQKKIITNQHLYTIGPRLSEITTMHVHVQQHKTYLKLPQETPSVSRTQLHKRIWVVNRLLDLTVC